MPSDSQQRYYNDPERRSDLDVASAARTANVTLAAFPVDGFSALHARVNVTAVTGTSPTLDVALETTFDGTNWFTAGSFAQKTAVSSEFKSFAGLGSQARWKLTVGGTTPSLTHTIDTTYVRRTP